MSGFGGLLQLLRIIGGFVLFILIGPNARGNSERAQNLQLAAGSLIFGFVIGGVLYFWCLAQRADRAVISFLVTPVASLILALILHHISKSIPPEKGDTKMKQLDDFRYEVATSEKITIVCTPFGIPPEVIAAALDDGPIDPNPASPNPTYTFDASLPVGQSHFFKVECDFVQAPNTAKTVVEITGEVSGQVTGPFSVPILKTDNIHDPTFRFRVVS